MRRFALSALFAMGLAACTTVLDLRGTSGEGGLVDGGSEEGSVVDFEGGAAKGCTIKLDPSPVVDFGQVFASKGGAVFVTLTNPNDTTVSVRTTGSNAFGLSLPTDVGPDVVIPVAATLNPQVVPFLEAGSQAPGVLVTGHYDITTERQGEPPKTCTTALDLKAELKADGYAFGPPVAFGNVPCGADVMREATIESRGVPDGSTWFSIGVSSPFSAPTGGAVAPDALTKIAVKLNVPMASPQALSTSFKVSIASSPIDSHDFPVTAMPTGGYITFNPSPLKLLGAANGVIGATNTGNAPVSVSFVTNPPGQFSLTPQTVNNLPAGATVNIAVVRNPQMPVAVTVTAVLANPPSPAPLCGSMSATIEP